MFDIGFWELTIVVLVALLVIGPDKLPGVARTLGRWTGRIRLYMNNVKNDIDRELRLQELQDMMRQTERNMSYDILEKNDRPDSSGEKPAPSGEFTPPDASSPPGPAGGATSSDQTRTS